MAAGGEAQDPDAMRINLPLHRLGTDGANGMLSIEQRHQEAAFGQSVFQDDRRDAVPIEPFGNRIAFAFRDMADVAATGTDDHRRAIGLVFGREIDLQL